MRGSSMRMPDPVARDAWLGDLEHGVADPVAVADADLVVGEALDGEVLAELPVHEVVAAELALPVAVGVELVDEDGALLAAVAGEIALAVAVDVQPAHPARPADRAPCRPRCARSGPATARPAAGRR